MATFAISYGIFLLVVYLTAYYDIKKYEGTGLDKEKEEE